MRSAIIIAALLAATPAWVREAPKPNACAKSSPDKQSAECRALIEATVKPTEDCERNNMPVSWSPQQIVGNPYLMSAFEARVAAELAECRRKKAKAERAQELDDLHAVRLDLDAIARAMTKGQRAPMTQDNDDLPPGGKWLGLFNDRVKLWWQYSTAPMKDRAYEKPDGSVAMGHQRWPSVEAWFKDMEGAWKLDKAPTDGKPN
jgi:hypothetical protein